MQKHTLQWKKAIQLFLLAFMLCFVGIAESHAQSDETIEPPDRLQADWGAICPTGVMLYYRVLSPATDHVVAVSHPNYSGGNPYQNYTEPVGEIIIPETVTHNGVVYTVVSIDNQTFNKCSRLTGSLVIPNTITTIGQQAFNGCTGFTGTLTLGNSVTTIGSTAFKNCGFTGDIVIPNSVIEIGFNAFESCSGFNGTLTLPEGLTEIGGYAFVGCSGLKGSLTIPNSVTELGYGAFSGCSGFDGELTLPDNLSFINAFVFKGCSGLIGDLVIPGSVSYINQEAFYGCNGFSEIYVIRETPPTLNANNIFTISASTPVFVPYCGFSDYKTATNWTRFTNFRGCTYFITEGNWSNSNNWTCSAAPTNTQHAVIVANCEMSASTSLDTLTIFKNKVLSVEPNLTLTVNNAIRNKGTAASFIIGDGCQLFHHNNNVLATVKKSVNAFSSTRNGWNLISPPLASNPEVTTVENLLSSTNTYDLFYYDEPTHYWMNQKITENNFTELKSGRGYLYANSGNVTLAYPGKLKNGFTTTTISTLSYQSDLLKGFNLIGNPYAHNITSVSSVNVAPAFYRMNELATDLVVSNISASEPLKPAEAIFVKATAGNASVTFHPSSRAETETEVTGSFCLELLEDGKISDRLLVKRNEGSDFQKFSLTDNRTKLFAVRDKEELAIVVCDNNEQAVNFKTANNGTYTISVTLQDIEADYLHLIDNLTGSNIDLLVTPSYTFEAKVSDYASRFRLVFSPEAIENDSDIFAYIANGEFIIVNEGMATLQVIDLTGRILSTETVNGSFNMPINLSSGVYMLRLISESNVKTQKIVVE